MQLSRKPLFLFIFMHFLLKCLQMDRYQRHITLTHYSPIEIKTRMTDVLYIYLRIDRFSCRKLRYTSIYHYRILL